MPAKVFVGNLSVDTDPRELRKLFAQEGRVLDVDLRSDGKAGGKGTAIVTFADERQAAASVRRFNGQELDGRKLAVSATDPAS